MAEESKSLVESSELIAGIIGALVTLLLTVWYDNVKDWNKNKSIRKLILADIRMQRRVMNDFVQELHNLKIHIKTAWWSPYTAFMFVHTDNVYKSNTMIDYHQAFGDDTFLIFQSVYERLVLIKKESTRDIWVTFSDAYNRLKRMELKNDSDKEK